MTQPSGTSRQTMRYSLDEVLSGMLASTTRGDFTDDTQRLGSIFKALSGKHALLAPFAAVGGEADFSALLQGALQKMVDRNLLSREAGRYVLTEKGRASCVSSKQVLFNRSDVGLLEAAALDFDAACA